MSDRYQLQRSIVYALAHMVGLHAFVRMQIHLTYLALKGRLLTLPRPITAATQSRCLTDLRGQWPTKAAWAVAGALGCTGV